MGKKTIILIGPASPPLGGEALSFLMFLDYLKTNQNIDIQLIDKCFEQKNNIFRKLTNPIRVVSILFFLMLVKDAGGLYITCGQSKGGIFRDCIILFLSQIFKVPIIMHLHGGGIKLAYESGNSMLKYLMRHMYQKPDCIIVLGKSLQDQFFFLETQEHIKIIVNSYFKDTPSIDPLESEYDHLKKHDHLKLVYLSHVLPSKGMFDILDALVILKEKQIPFQFHFGGNIIPEGKMTKTSIRKSIQNYKRQLGERFIVHGFIQKDEKWQLLLQSNIFLLPTQFSMEGQPISIIEAMYAGNCVIATQYRGIPDLVEHNVNGWFVRPDDPETIAEKLIWLWHHPEAMRKICILNQTQSKVKYSPDRFLAQLEDTVAQAFSI